ncbi:MAG: DUF2779 domain-containing protein [Thermomicrobiales bacterium]
MAKAHRLTKTEFIRYLTCPAWAWVVRHQPERVPATNAITQRAFDRGNQVEALAIQQFPDGEQIDARRTDIAARMTDEAVRRGATTLFQAAASTSFGLVARADILQRSGDGWNLYEVKSSASSRSDPRKIQKRYLEDIAFQVHAFTDSGFTIRSASIMHLDGTYRRNGDLDHNLLFQTTPLTSEVRGVYETLGRTIETAFAVLADVDHEPECTCHLRAKANRCELFGLFHPEFPPVNSVLDLRLSKDKLQRVLERGVTSLLDWPSDIALTDKQRETVEFRRAGSPKVDPAKLKAILETYRYPLYFYDYETFAPAVPQFGGSGPYEAIPFQYSLHIVHEDGRMEHRQFLWTERDSDPVPVLADQIVRDIGPTGTLVAWNAGYEKGCNTRMGERFPEYRHAFAELNARTVDLGDIVKHEAWVHPDFRGSWSLKNVLPVAAPDLNYKLLEIGEGGLASERWMQAVTDDKSSMDDSEREAIFSALRTYCHLDTLAMVRVWQKSRELAGLTMEPQLAEVR